MTPMPTSFEHWKTELLILGNIVQDDDRTMEVADLDAALLTDDLPPEAYADPGFLQYLKTGAQSAGTSR